MLNNENCASNAQYKIFNYNKKKTQIDSRDTYLHY